MNTSDRCHRLRGKSEEVVPVGRDAVSTDCDPQ